MVPTPLSAFCGDSRETLEVEAVLAFPPAGDGQADERRGVFVGRGGPMPRVYVPALCAARTGKGLLA